MTTKSELASYNHYLEVLKGNNPTEYEAELKRYRRFLRVFLRKRVPTDCPYALPLRKSLKVYRGYDH